MTRIEFARDDVDGGPVQLVLTRFDATASAGFDSGVLSSVRSDIEKHWKPRFDSPLLAGFDPDRDWNWEEDVLKPKPLNIRDGSPHNGAMLLLQSRRDAQPEGIVRLLYNWQTVKLPERASAREGLGRPLVTYIDTLAVAPWNRRAGLAPPPRVRALGKLLLFVAMLLSEENGKAGRIALHSARTAESWYREQFKGASFTYDAEELGPGFDPLDPAKHGPYVEVDDQIVKSYSSSIKELLGKQMPVLFEILSDHLRAKAMHKYYLDE